MYLPGPKVEHAELIDINAATFVQLEIPNADSSCKLALRACAVKTCCKVCHMSYMDLHCTWHTMSIYALHFNAQIAPPTTEVHVLLLGA